MDEARIAKEQACTNCGSLIDGNFCKHCGQKVTKHNTIWHMLVHFVSDIFHYDGRFMRTLRLLLTRPGFLSLEYKNGVKEKYVDPFRLYLFISATAFIVAISLGNHQDTVTKISNPGYIHFIDSTRLALQNDTAYQTKLERVRYHTIKITPSGIKTDMLVVTDMLRHGERYYDSVQNTLIPEKRSKGYRRFKERRIARVYEIYDTAPYNFLKKQGERKNLLIPKSVLISIPSCILCLFVLYYKKRKEYPSAYHAVFVMHYYTLLWFSILLYAIIDIWVGSYGIVDSIFDLREDSLILGLFVYLYIAMLRFYQDNWWISLIKTIILTIVVAFIYYSILMVFKQYYIISLVSLIA